MFLIKSFIWFVFLFVGGVTFVSLERSMRKRGWRVKKKREKLLILCSTMLVSYFPLSFFLFNIYINIFVFRWIGVACIQEKICKLT